MNKPILLAAMIFGSTAYGQSVWFKVASENQTVTVTASTQVRYGTAALTTGTYCSSAGCWETATKTGTFVAGNSIFPADPAPYYTKELDVLETNSPQTVTVNGTAVTVPALVPAPTPTPTPAPTPTAPTLLGTFTCTVQMYSNMTFTANSSQCVKQ